MRPVTWLAPWVNTPSIEATLVPRPIWMALDPPWPAPPEPAPERVWLRASWNVMTEALKPAVFTLAMLLPTTSIIVWCDRRPEIPANIERIMSVWFLPVGTVRGSWSTSIRDVVRLYLSSPSPLALGLGDHLHHVRQRDPLTEPDPVDRADDGLARGPDSGDLLAREADGQ